MGCCCHPTARSYMVRDGKAWRKRGTARLGRARLDSAGPGLAWQGRAWHGLSNIAGLVYEGPALRCIISFSFLYRQTNKEPHSMMSRSLWRAIYSERTKIGGGTTHWRTKIGGEPRWQVEPDNNSEPLTTENQNVKRAKLPENHGLWRAGASWRTTNRPRAENGR
jgi:hypothetical protein